MKFNCGLTGKTKRQQIMERLYKKEKYFSNWHKVFAWLPHRIRDNDCRWLEYVERRYSYVCIDPITIQIVLRYPEYRELRDK